MTQTEAETLIEQARALWPDWKPNDAQLGEWAELLKGWPFVQAQAALRQHWQDSKWKEPRPGGVLSALRQARQDHQGGPRRRGDITHADRFIGGWVACVEGSKAGYVQTLWGSPGRMPSPDQAYAMLDDLRAGLEAMWGGQWQVVRSLVGPLSYEQYRQAEHEGIKQRMAALDRPRRFRRREAPTP